MSLQAPSSPPNSNLGYVFDVKGLMGDISLKGAKFSKIDPAQ